MVFSPDGRRLAIGRMNDTASLWSIATGKPLGVVLQNRFDARLQAVIGVAVAFNSDGSRVATASDLSYARVWDAAAGAPLTPLLQHASAVNHARFSPDARRLVTASNDRTARVWNVLLGDGTPDSAALLADLAELAGGFASSDTGIVSPLDREGVRRRLLDVRTSRVRIRELDALIADLQSTGGR
jgi:WD40 repeat protein